MASQLTTDIQLLAEDTANAFRLGYEGYSNQLFIEFIDNLSEFSERYKLNERPEFNHVIQVMLDAQQRNDVLFLADILQYELSSLLSQLIQ